MAKTSGRGFIDLERQEQQRGNFVQGERGGEGGRGNARAWSQRESAGADRVDELAAHHERASFHHETASFHHGQAAKQLSSGRHGIAQRHADAAEQHGQDAQAHGQRALRTSSELEAQRERGQHVSDRRTGSDRRAAQPQGGGRSLAEGMTGAAGSDTTGQAGFSGRSAPEQAGIGDAASKVEQSSGQEIADSALPNGKPGSAKN